MIKAIYHLFFGKPINFYSPYSIDETYDRLEDASRREKRKASRLRSIWEILSRRHQDYLLIRLEAIDSQSYRFQAHRDESGGIRINLRGQVREDESGVKVTGRVRVNIFTLLMIIVWLLVLIVISGFMISILFIETPFIVVPLFFGLMLFVYILSVKRDQNKLYDRIEAMIGKSKQKNDNNSKNIQNTAIRIL